MFVISVIVVLYSRNVLFDLLVLMMKRFFVLVLLDVLSCLMILLLMKCGLVLSLCRVVMIIFVEVVFLCVLVIEMRWCELIS